MSLVKDGILRARIESWDDIHIYTKYFSDDLGFIFRGQADSSWELETSLNRYLNTLDPKLKNNTVYEYHLENFRESVRGRGLSTENLTENDLWTIGQHYGLYTPLLDWTSSFYIAIYFAFIDGLKPSKDYRTLFALHKKGVCEKLVAFNKEKENYNKFEIIESLSDDNPRIVSQAGLFTKFPLDFDLPKWIENNFSGSQEAHLFILEINNSARSRILKELYLMNINPKTIFPDLHGSSLNCNHILTLMAEKAVNVLKI